MKSDSHITDSRLATFANRNEAMTFLKELRRNPQALRSTQDGALALSIPPADMLILQAKYPVLKVGGSYEKKRFWAWFLKQSESLPYRVRG